MVELLLRSFSKEIRKLGGRDTQGGLALVQRAKAFPGLMSAELLHSPSEADDSSTLQAAVRQTCQELVSASRRINAALQRPNSKARGVAAAQLFAACVLVDACVDITLRPDGTTPDPNTQHSLRSCVQLLLGPGLTALHNYDLSKDAVAMYALDAETSDMLVPVQIYLMSALLAEIHGEDVELGALARQLAPPELLLPWLAAAAKAATLLHGSSLGTGRSSELLGHTSATLWVVLNRKPFRPHAEALGADPALQHSQVQLLVPALRAAAVAVQLPLDRRPASFNWRAVQTVSQVLASSYLKHGLAQQLQAQEGDGDNSSASPWRLLHSMAQLVVHAPHDPVMDDGQTFNGRLWPCLLGLLMAACGVVDGVAPTEQLQGQQGQQAQQAAALLQQTVLRMPRSLQLAAVEAAGLAAEGTAAARLSAGCAVRLCLDWQRVAATLAWLLPAGQREGEPPAEDSMGAALASLCNGATSGAAAGAAAAAAAANCARLAAVPGWCAAAGAMLRALPQVAGVLVALRQSGEVLAARMLMPAQLADALLGTAASISTACRACAANCLMADAGTAHAAAKAAWQLHTACCRAVHWREAEARGGGALWEGDLNRVQRAWLLTTLLDSYNTAATIDTFLAIGQAMSDPTGQLTEQLGPAIGVGLPGSCLAGQLRAMSAGHLDAVLCLLSPGGVDPAPEELALFVATLCPSDCLEAVKSLLLASRLCSPACCALWSPLRRQCLDALWLRFLAAEGEDSPGELTCSHAVLLAVAAPVPSLVAWVAGTGVLALKIDELAVCAATTLPNSNMPLYAGLRTVLEALEALSSGAGGLSLPANSTLAQQAAALAAAVAHVQAAGVQQQTCAQYAALIEHLRSEALPAALAVAAALLEWQPAEEQVAAGRLAAAQAAAGRSCAYLRCANLQVLENAGPAAQQGNGTLRCGGCRAVRYCGTTCSHADWRAGHKRVCAALAKVQLEQQQ